MQALPDGVESRDAREADELTPPGAIPPKTIACRLRQRPIASNKSCAASVSEIPELAAQLF